LPGANSLSVLSVRDSRSFFFGFKFGIEKKTFLIDIAISFAGLKLYLHGLILELENGHDSNSGCAIDI
jgi:hypothetical protein